MRRKWYFKLIDSLAFLLSLSMAACIQPITAPSVSALKPGTQIGAMVITPGPVPFDLEIPPYVAFCNANPQLEPDLTAAKPGIYMIECSMPPLSQMMIGFGWVTRDEQQRDESWDVIDTELYINGQPIDQEAFGRLDAVIPMTGLPDADANQAVNLPLRVWNVMLENITPGQLTLRYVWHLSQEVFDGISTYPAGVYDLTYKITVDESLAETEGAPAPVELVRQPVEFVRKIDTSAQQIQNAVSLAVDSEGNVYITDSSDNPRVLKYDSQGEFVMAWGGRGSGEGQFEFIPPTPDAGPGSGFVTVDGQGNVYVSDGYNFRVQKFDSEGKFLMQFGSKGLGEGQFDEPCTGPIYVDSQGSIYVSTFPRVQKFDAEGQFLAAYGTAGDGDGQFMGAAIGAIDSEGNLYIADLLNARVQKLDSDGKFLLQWGSTGTEVEQFNMPVAIVMDSVSRLYVADNTSRIQIFDIDGNFLDMWSETGDENPPLGGEISGLAIDGQDNIYVADGVSSSIYVFHPR